MPIPLRVLILEDRPADVEPMLYELRQADFDPDWTRVDTEAGFLAALQGDLDVILADYHLPQFDALRALHQVQERNIDIPFIVITGVLEDGAIACLKDGANDYLLKDHLARLGTAVIQALEQQRLRADKRQMDENLRRSERQFRAIIERSSDAVTILDPEGTLIYAGPSTSRILGFTPEELVNRNIFDVVHPESHAALTSMLAEVVQDPGRTGIAQYRAWHKDGTWRFMEGVATNLLNEPAVEGIVVNSRDITEHKLLEEQLSRQAFYDSLTGLPNRALFMDRLDQAVGRANRYRDDIYPAIAVFFLDLDDFKIINDSLGHAAGDTLLSAVGRRLLTSLRPGDTAARFGGDEFTILLEDISQGRDVVKVAERLLESLRRPYQLDGHEVFVTGSIGISVSRPSQFRSADLLRDADVALYRAKALGKATMVVFEPSMSTEALARLDLETDLRYAVERGQLRLHYQPEVDLQTNVIRGIEALVRWEHPLNGMMGPSQFIPLAEETDLILPIGRWVLQEACRQAYAWQGLLPSGQPLVVSVNLSGRQFQHPNLAIEVAQVLRETNLSPHCLQLEITETVLMRDEPATESTLDALRALGVPLAIDDFGTGYSSLSYLRRFPASTLKIDYSFTSAIGHDEKASAILRAVTSLGHALGMDVVAEGIETVTQLAYLQAMGCDQGQGFYLSRPIPAEGMPELLAAGLLGR